MEPEVSLEEQLYFGSIEVRFEPVAGKLHNNISFEEIRTPDIEEIAKSRSTPLKSIDEEKTLISPAIPALDLTLNGILTIIDIVLYLLLLTNSNRRTRRNSSFNFTKAFTKVKEWKYCRVPKWSSICSY
jgi:hypothetical protein